MIMMFVYDGAMTVAVCVSYTVNRIAEAMRADIPIPKRIDKAHFRVLVALSFHTGGRGKKMTTRSTTMLNRIVSHQSRVEMYAREESKKRSLCCYPKTIRRQDDCTYLKGVTAL